MSRELSPRSSYSQQLEFEEELLTDLTMNFDPDTIKKLKREFEQCSDDMQMDDFIIILKGHLRGWRPDLDNRERILTKLLVTLFKEIDMNSNNSLQWDEFTNYIIEKATIINTTKKNRVDAIKNYSVSAVHCTHRSDSNVEHLVSLESVDRIGVVEDYSNVVKFYSPETGQTIGKELKIEIENSKTVKYRCEYCKATASVKVVDLEEKKAKCECQELTFPYKKAKKAPVLNALYLPEPEYNILVTANHDGSIRSWGTNGSNFHSVNNYEGGFPLLQTHEAQRSLAWDGSTGLLYSGEKGGGINIWNMREKKSNPEKMLQEDGHTDMVTDLISVSKLQFLISCSLDQKVILWDMIKGTPRRVYSEHSKGVLSLAFNTEYRLLFSAGFDHNICVWNPYINTVSFTIEGHNSSLVGVRVIPDSPQVISADIEGWVKIWDIRNLGCVQTFNVEENETGYRFNLADFLYLQKQQRLAFGGKKLIFYDYDRNHGPTLVDDQLPLSAFYSPYNKVILTPTNQRVKVWNALSGRLANIYGGTQHGEISYVDMDQLQKRIFVGDSTGVTYVYNIKNGALIKTLAEHPSEVTYITSCFSKNWQLIITFSSSMIIMHEDSELSDTKIWRKIVLDSGFYVTAACSIINSNLEVLVAGSTEGLIKTWSLDLGKEEGMPMRQDDGRGNCEITAMQGVPKKHFMIVCDSLGNIVIWGLPPHAAKYSKLVSFHHAETRNEPATAVQAFLLKNKLLYTGDERGTIRLLRLKIMDQLQQTSEDGSARMLDVVQSELVEINAKTPVRAHTEGIRHLFYIEETRSIISTSYDKKVKVWDAKTLDLLGTLQQGSGSHRPRVSSRGDADPDWRLTFDLGSIIEQEEAELTEVIQRLRRRAASERVKLSREGAGTAPHTEEEIKHTLEPDKLPPIHVLAPVQSKDSLPSDFTKVYSIANAKSGVVPNDLLLSRVPGQSVIASLKQRQRTLGSVVMLRQGNGFERERRGRAMGQSVSQAQLSKYFDLDNADSQLRRKIAKVGTKAARKLAEALDDSRLLL